ncbi:hypothetical protein TrST_g4103 [Triparma strigata]|uniref:DUF6816 domain-containing protein n=1 Tax=Triparma strigata TaxID=1606541 RepID=A0A9W7EFP9_9STRA|nr:hypothetical protein TrST_g4103 [Triparma strigata]
MGVGLFGGHARLDRGRDEIGNEKANLNYMCRFLNTPSGTIADREYNVRSIISNSMGAMSILSLEGGRLPNEVTVSIQPPEASGVIFKSQLLTTGRLSSPLPTPTSPTFYTSEIGRSVLETLTPSSPRTVTLKEVETISSYTVINDDLVLGRQRSATYLTPGEDYGSVEFRMWQAAGGVKGRAVEIRDYELIYERVR